FTGNRGAVSVNSLLEAHRAQQRDLALLVRDEALAFERAEPLVDALARGADQRGELRLLHSVGDHGASRGQIPVSPAGHLQQDAREPRWNVQERSVLNQLSIASQVVAHRRQKLGGHAGMLCQELAKSIALEHQLHAWLGGDRVRRAWLVVEQRKLAVELA